MVMQRYPEKNDTTWICVKLDRALGVGDFRSRATWSSRCQPGWDIEAFPACMAVEMSRILEKAYDAQLGDGEYLSNLFGYVAYLSWRRSGLGRLWCRWSSGSCAGAPLFALGMAVNFSSVQ